MSQVKRDILVVVKNEFISDEAIEHEVSYLNQLLHTAESDEQFCIAHELVDRNWITNKASSILKASKIAPLKPFIFLINKN